MVPTGVALRDVRQQLFDAAERVLVSAGPGALTSRAVTAEAGCAKGVLHRHFADFDAFLAEFVLARVARVEARAADLRAAVGAGSVTGNVTAAMVDLFDPVAVAVVGLVVARDGLRARLRELGRPPGIPVLAEVAEAFAAYLAAERERGRVAADADVETIGRTLVGAAHLQFAGRDGGPPEERALHRIVAAVVGPVVT